MKRKALASTLSIALLSSALFVSSVQAERWSTPTQITTLKLYLHVAPSISADGSKIALPVYSKGIFVSELDEDLNAPIPTTPVIAAVVIGAVIGVGLLVYFKKRKKQVER